MYSTPSFPIVHSFRCLLLPALGVAQQLVVELGSREVAVERDTLVDGVDVGRLGEVGRRPAVNVLGEGPGARRVRVGEHASGGNDGLVAKDGLDRAGDEGERVRVAGSNRRGLEAGLALLGVDLDGQVLDVLLGAGLGAEDGRGEAVLLRQGPRRST